MNRRAATGRGAVVDKGAVARRRTVEEVRAATPPLLVKVPLPAVEPSSKKVIPPLLMKVALPAVEVPRKIVKLKLVKVVELPAVALLVKIIRPPPPMTKFWVVPELFVMPTPLRVRFSPNWELPVMV